MPDRVDPRVRQAAIAAYESLLAGNVEPLIEMLSANVEWNEYALGRHGQTVLGRDRVAEHVRSRMRSSTTVTLRALVVRGSSIEAEVSDPWWCPLPRVQAVIASVTGGTFRQTLALAGGIERIDSRAMLVGPLTPEAEMLAVTLGR